MRKIIYFIGFVLMAAGLVLAIPAFLGWIDFIFSFDFFIESLFDYLAGVEFESILSDGKSNFIQFIIGSFLINSSWWLLKIANQNKPSTEININDGNYNESIEGDYIQGNKLR